MMREEDDVKYYVGYFNIMKVHSCTQLNSVNLNEIVKPVKNLIQSFMVISGRENGIIPVISTGKLI